MAYPHVLAHVAVVTEENLRAHLGDAHGIFFDGESNPRSMSGVHNLAHEVDARMNSYPTPALPQAEEPPLKTRRRRAATKKRSDGQIPQEAS